MAAMAPSRSTRCITLPPSTAPNTLASLGSASSEYSDCDSRTGLGFSMRQGVLSQQVALQVGFRLALYAGVRMRRHERPAAAGVHQRTVLHGRVVPLQHVADAHEAVLIPDHAEAHGVGGRAARKARTGVRVTQVAEGNQGVFPRLDRLLRIGLTVSRPGISQGHGGCPARPVEAR